MPDYINLCLVIVGHEFRRDNLGISHSEGVNEVVNCDFCRIG